MLERIKKRDETIRRFVHTSLTVEDFACRIAYTSKVTYGKISGVMLPQASGFILFLFQLNTVLRSCAETICEQNEDDVPVAKDKERKVKREVKGWVRGREVEKQKYREEKVDTYPRDTSVFCERSVASSQLYVAILLASHWYCAEYFWSVLSCPQSPGVGNNMQIRCSTYVYYSPYFHYSRRTRMTYVPCNGNMYIPDTWPSSYTSRRVRPPFWRGPKTVLNPFLSVIFREVQMLEFQNFRIKHFIHV